MRKVPLNRALIMLFLVMILLPLQPASTLQAADGFSDVDGQRYAWAANSIRIMADKQILTGFPDGLFRPDRAISKAEWTAMVYRLFDRYRPNVFAKGERKLGGFADVPASHWAYQPILEIYDASFQIGGYGVNSNGALAFRPDMALTRLQLAQMLYSFFDNRLIDPRLSGNDACAAVSGFDDIPVSMLGDAEAYRSAAADGRYLSGGFMSAENGTIFPTLFMGHSLKDCNLGDDPLSNVQAKALASLHSSGIMTATKEGYFRPLEPVTRAEAVTILDRTYNYFKKNYGLSYYSSIELEGQGYAGSGTDSGSSSGSSANPSGTYNYNPDSNVIKPGNDSGTNGDNTNWSSKSVIQVRDYFDDKGVIVKDIQANGEIETAVQPKGQKYLSIHLKSKEKVDLYIILDGKVGFVKYEELPLNLTVSDVTTVGIRSQTRSPNPNIKGDFTATLTVKLSNEEPVGGKKKK